MPANSGRLDEFRLKEVDRRAPDTLARMGRKALNLSGVRPSIGTENPIPEKMDHRKITVRVPVMNEVQLLFTSEP